MVGKTAANNTVMLNDQPLKVSASGDYAFGFSRDDNNTYQLVITDNQGNKVEKTLKPAPQKYNIQRVNGIKKAIMNEMLKRKPARKKTVPKLKQYVKYQVILMPLLKVLSRQLMVLLPVFMVANGFITACLKVRIMV